MQLGVMKWFKYILLLFICVILLAKLCYASSPISETEVLFSKINLDYPGLEEVKQKVKNGDFDSAGHLYVSYLKQRSYPKWYIDWHDFNSDKVRKAQYNTKDVDRFVQNELVSCGIWHKFGKQVIWTHNPTENNYNEWTWQLNRHAHWVSLGEAYWATGDEKYSKAFVAQLNSWLDQCPRPSDSGRRVGSAWRSLDAGLRMTNSWPYSFYYFLGSDSFDEQSILRMVLSFYEHGVHLRKYNTSNNWLSIEMAGLYTVGALFPEFKDAEEWRSFASEKIYDEEEGQFYPDGAQVELSPSYHANSMTGISLVCRLAKMNSYPLPKDYVKRLEKAYVVCENLMMPDGRLPAVNDGEWVECRQRYLSVARELFPSRQDFEYLTTKGQLGKKPAFTSVFMPWAGWCVMRTGWNADDYYSLYEIGPYGAGHQHEDKLSFIIYAFGQKLITECGVYAYDKSKWYEYALSSRGHNTVRIDGLDQNRYQSRTDESILYSKEPITHSWTSTRRYDLAKGVYNDGFGPKQDKSVIHTRHIKFIKKGVKYWLVVDDFQPLDEKEHTYDSWFHFNTKEYSTYSELNVVCSNDENEANIAIVRLNPEKNMDVIVGQEDPEVQGWVSEKSSNNGYTMRPVATPVFHNKGTGRLREFYVILPYDKGSKMPVTQIKQVSENKYRIYLEGDKSITVKIPR